MVRRRVIEYHESQGGGSLVVKNSYVKPQHIDLCQNLSFVSSISPLSHMLYINIYVARLDPTLSPLGPTPKHLNYKKKLNITKITQFSKSFHLNKLQHQPPTKNNKYYIFLFYFLSYFTTLQNSTIKFI